MAAPGASDDAYPRATQLLRRAAEHARRGASVAAQRDVRDALRVAPQSARHLALAATLLARLGLDDKAARLREAADACRTKLRAPTPGVTHASAPLSAADTPGTPAVHRLPAELLVAIVAHLSPASRHACACVCKWWHACLGGHAPLWDEVRLKASSAPASDRAALQAQRGALRRYLARGRTHVRRVHLTPPLTNSVRPWAYLDVAQLTSLTLACDAACAAPWLAYAARLPSLTALTVEAPKDTSPHPWSRARLRLTDVRAPLRRLVLRHVPCLAWDDASTAALGAHLQVLVLDAGPAWLRPADVLAQCAPGLDVLLQRRADALEHLEVSGTAVWATAWPLAQGASVWPQLHTLCAPWSLLGAAPRLPRLTDWTTPALPKGRTLAEHAAFVSGAAPSVVTWTLRLTGDAHVAALEAVAPALLQVHTVHVDVVEAAPDATAPPTLAAARHAPLTAAVLVRLLTPGALHGAVWWPHLHTLRIHNDTSVRGRELYELAAVRAWLSRGHTPGDAWAALRAARQAAAPRAAQAGGALRRGAGAGVSAPAPTAPLAPRAVPAPPSSAAPACVALQRLDVDTCIELAPDVVPRLQRLVHEVHWSATSVARAQCRARYQQGGRSRRG